MSHRPHLTIPRTMVTRSGHRNLVEKVIEKEALPCVTQYSIWAFVMAEREPKIINTPEFTG